MEAASQPCLLRGRLAADWTPPPALRATSPPRGEGISASAAKIVSADARPDARWT